MDTSAVPLGESAWQAILDHVVEHGDAAETSFLEAKGQFDLTSTADLVKIAKFLLGTGNRTVDDAARHFQGYSVMVLGAEHGRAAGVQRTVEPHEIANRLRPYLGQTFPGYEFGRIPVGPDCDVLFVIGSPPKPGQPPFPCHKTFQGQKGQDALTDGAIYVRAQTETRPARAGEVLALLDRLLAGGQRPPVDLLIEAAPVHRVIGVEQLLTEMYDLVDKRFAEHTPPPELTPGLGPGGIRLPGMPAPMSTEERAQELTRWRDARSKYIAVGRSHLLGTALRGLEIVVTSRGRHITKPELRLVFHGCTAVEYLDPDEFDFDSLVEPVVRPSRSPWEIDVPPMPRFEPAGYPVDWSTTGDTVAITLTPTDFRPETPWRTDADDLCVVVVDDRASVRVTWSLTEDGVDTTTGGEFDVSVAAADDARELVRSVGDQPPG